MNDDRQEFDNLEDAVREIAALRRTIRHKERDYRMLSRLNENTDLLRSVVEREKKTQYLYNDLLLAHAPNMIFLFDEQLRFVIGSHACRRLTQRGQPLLQRPLTLLFRDEVSKDWVRKIARLNDEVLGTRSQIEFNDNIRVGGEGMLNAHIVIGPIVDESSACRGSIMSITDVSELMRARRLADEAAESKTRFLAHMSHEIRTPVNAIKGLSELLALTSLTPTQMNYVNNVVSSADSLIGVINDVLDLSKITANKIEFVIAAYGLHRLLLDICGIIGLRAEEKGLDLYLDVAPSLPGRLLGDETRIKQVLINLLSNAVKYTKTEQVSLRVSSRPLAEGRVSLTFKVEDTGIGIRKEDMRHLFDAYTRFDPHVNRAVQGTGLGLAISKRLAAAMGGDITLSSVYGKGSVFALAVPQDVEDEEPLASLESPEETKVLLLGPHQRMKNVGVMLDAFVVAWTALDVANAQKLAVGERQLPECGAPGQPYTHCVYSDILPERSMAGLRDQLPNCRFAVLRSLINSMDQPGRRDHNLYLPLLVTELAKFLNRSGRRTTTRRCNDGENLASVILETRNATALVVDDNRINLMVCEKMLELYGLTVKTAASGEEALDMCLSDKYDIIFMDHMMPGMDGVEVAGRLRTHAGPNRKTPIVALTANVVNNMRSFYTQKGMDDFVGKPIDREELSRVLRQWLPVEKIVNASSLGRLDND